MTAAIIRCDICGDLCSRCDTVLHLNRRTRSHQRQVFKEEQQSIQVELHEGCGRLKLFWLLALADPRSLKAIIEFKGHDIENSNLPNTTMTSSGSCCRFCGNQTLALNGVCADEVCRQFASTACSKVLSCGHFCGGLNSDENCLQCLRSECSKDLKQDAEDVCMICFTDTLSSAPVVKLDCGHLFHFHCCESLLKNKWNGPRITFGFLNCSICKVEMSHPSLEKYLSPLRELQQEVRRKASQRLEYEGLSFCEAIISEGSRFFSKPVDFAISKYAYYLCYKCNKAYYGGEIRCELEADLKDNFEERELVCGACSDVTRAQICTKHGTDFLEYKCRYCCSVAVYFCFGTTHFCRTCHDDFQRIVGVPKHTLPSCPAGPGAQKLQGTECPLHVIHPPTGEEFALGCGVCRNANTF